MIFLPSSNSLSDNQELNESLEQIQESHNEEEGSVEIIQQANADLRAPLSPPPPPLPISASHIDQTHMSPTKEQEEQEGSENLTNIENQESQQDDDNDDDLPETQPCF